jgi:hypothetical protein
MRGRRAQQHRGADGERVVADDRGQRRRRRDDDACAGQRRDGRDDA